MARKIKDWAAIVVIVALCALGLVVLTKAASACMDRGGMFVMVGKVPVCVGGR